MLSHFSHNACNSVRSVGRARARAWQKCSGDVRSSSCPVQMDAAKPNCCHCRVPSTTHPPLLCLPALPSAPSTTPTLLQPRHCLLLRQDGVQLRLDRAHRVRDAAGAGLAAQRHAHQAALLYSTAPGLHGTQLAPQRNLLARLNARFGDLKGAGAGGSRRARAAGPGRSKWLAWGVPGLRVRGAGE